MIDIDLSTTEKVFALSAVAAAWLSGYLLGYLRGKR